MKKIVLVLIAVSSLVSALTISDSLKVTDECLAELGKINLKMTEASLLNYEKTAIIMDNNEVLSEENEIYVINNKKLRVENKKLRVENKKLQNKLVTTMNTDKQEKKIPAALKRREQIHIKSLELQKKYGKLSNIELFNKNIYRVPVHMLNVRFGHSKKYSISAILKKGQMINFTKIKRKKFYNREVIWVKTASGWMYIPSINDTLIISSLFKDENKMALHHSMGGEKG